MIEWFITKGLFRNANHAIWFFCSGAMFLLVLANWFLPQKSWALFIIPAIAHVPPLVKSILVVSQKEESEIYSKDCIWFNSLMIVFYTILVFVDKCG
ncbi:MAG: hypothetical protein WC794_02765 [Candidatus Doudnabacteria bacterium]|jgi:hypothetical protein